MTGTLEKREAPSLSLLADLEAAGALSVIGLHLTEPNLPYARYEALCVLLGKMHEAVRFAIGDAILLGERLFKEEAYQAIELLGLSETARREYVRVAERVPRSTRRKTLSWSHHRAVASLPPPEQKEWLRKAEAEQLSHHQLREVLRNGSEPAAVKACRCCHRPFDEA
jgi:hypothetical protein